MRSVAPSIEGVSRFALLRFSLGVPIGWLKTSACLDGIASMIQQTELPHGVSRTVTNRVIPQQRHNVRTMRTWPGIENAKEPPKVGVGVSSLIVVRQMSATKEYARNAFLVLRSELVRECVLMMEGSSVGSLVDAVVGFR